MRFPLLVCALLLFSPLARLCYAAEPLAVQAVSADAHVSQSAIQQLRAAGPAGLRQLIKAHRSDIAAGPVDSDAWHRLSAAMDAVAAQRDAYASQLFWYTDLNQAEAAAKCAGKPILLLRMLGRLDQELSCANSRFFRTTLYPDPEVQKLLRDNFILLWETERPVPVITVDFGDGRVLKRTLTGNSAHYILDAEGRPIDVLPGLYSAGSFTHLLTDDLKLFRDLNGKNNEAWEKALCDFHINANKAIADSWIADARKLAIENPPTIDSADQAYWNRVIALHPENATLSHPVLSIIALKAPPAEAAARVAISKTLPEAPLVRMIRQLERSIAADTLQNEDLLHRKIHAWFINHPEQTFAELNENVYTQLFLTPRSDPWLGLAPADGYVAIDDGGLARAK